MHLQFLFYRNVCVCVRVNNILYHKTKTYMDIGHVIIAIITIIIIFNIHINTETARMEQSSRDVCVCVIHMHLQTVHYICYVIYIWIRYRNMCIHTHFPLCVSIIYTHTKQLLRCQIFDVIYFFPFFLSNFSLNTKIKSRRKKTVQMYTHHG